MDVESILAALIELAETLGIEVRRAPASADSSAHPGGAVVRLRGKPIVFLDMGASPAEQGEVLVSALRGRPELEGMFLPPEVRQAIEGGP